MVKNLNVKVVDLDGVAVTEAGKELTVGDCAVKALLAQTKQDQSPEDKMQCYELAKKIKSVPIACDLKSEEITKIKEKIGAYFIPVVVGFCFTELEK